MIISSTINDRFSAGEQWLKQKVAEDEMKLPENYERPVLYIKRSFNPFKNQVIRHAFAKEVYQFIFCI